MLKIHQAICAAQEDIKGISKGSKSKQGFNYRGIDAVYEAMQPILCKHKIFSCPEVLEERSEERKTKNGGNLIYRILKIKYVFFSEDGSCVYCTVIGEGMDSGDKASNKAMAVAHKYALCQVFTIPTKEKKDPEQDDEKLAPRDAEDCIQQIRNLKHSKHYHNYINSYKGFISSLPDAEKEDIRVEFGKAKERLWK
jgi:hypothetical protein